MEAKKKLPSVKRLTVSSLDPEQSPELLEALEKSRFVVCDIDYSLLNISQGHNQGVKNVADILGKDIADEFNQIFHIMLEGHRHKEDEEWGERDKFNQIIDKVKQLQKDIVPEYGLKYWSKSTMILIAAEDLEIKLTSEQLIKARDAYWEGRAEKSKLYPDTLPFVRKLKELEKPLFLQTGSYHILQIAEDLSLTYNPEAARKYKQEKMNQHLPFEPEGLIIGDPVDKPNPEFYEGVNEAIQQTTEQKLDEQMLSRILWIGDSGRNDLQFPREEYGCSTVLIKRDS